MLEKVKNTFKGRTTYNDSIITNIVTLAVSEVEGVAPNGEIVGEKAENASKFVQKLKFDIEKEVLYIEIAINVYYGYSIPEVAFKVQEVVKNGVENMTLYKLSSVDVTIIGVVTPKEA